MARDAAEEGRARREDRLRERFDDPSADRSAEPSAEEGTGFFAGGRDPRLSHAEHEVT